jgi:hypothetical protein
MSDPGRPNPDDEPESESERRTGNIVLLVFFLVIAGIGVWLVNAMISHRQIDDCLAQGRRDCGRIEVR